MKALRLVLVCIALALIVGLGWRLRHPAFQAPSLTALVAPPAPQPAAVKPPAAPDPAQARAEILSRLADAPDYAPFFDRLRTAFPSDYTGLVDAAADSVAKGGRVPNPDRLMFDAVRRLRQTRGVLAAQAEAGPLSGIFTAQLELLDALAGDNADLCVDFLYGGTSPDFMAFAATHREAIERLGIANLSAIVSGQDKHLERDQPRPEDFDALTTALKAKGLSDDEIAAVLDGKTFDPPLPNGRLCEAGRDYLRAVQAMPDEARLRLYALSAALLARS